MYVGPAELFLKRAGEMRRPGGLAAVGFLSGSGVEAARVRQKQGQPHYKTSPASLVYIGLRP